MIENPNDSLEKEKKKKKNCTNNKITSNEHNIGEI